MNEFKVGDKVYCPLLGEKIIRIEHAKDCPKPLVVKNNYVIWFLDCTGNPNNTYNSGMPFIFHATQENYELLSKLYPNVEFEKPPIRKTSQEVIQAMLDDGWGKVPVYYYEGKEECCGYATKTYATMTAEPFDPKTGKVIVDYVDGEIVTE